MHHSAPCTAAGTVTGVAGCLAVLLVSAPSPHAALDTIAAASSSPDPTGPLVAVVALAAWAAAGWLLLTSVVVVGAHLPGLVGQAARALAVRVAPAAARRAVEAALGLTVAVGVLAPPAALAAPSAGPAPAVAVTTAEVPWDLDWPDSGAPPRPDLSRPRSAATATATTSPAARRTATPPSRLARPAAPSVADPSGTPPSVAPPSVAPRSAVPPAAVPPAAVPRAATPWPAVPPSAVPPSAAPPAGPPADVRPSLATPTAGAVVVRTGDTLWSLAEAALRSAGTATPSDRQVAQAWPRWWAANRQVIGDDPDLLLPGTVLRPPRSSPAHH